MMSNKEVGGDRQFPNATNVGPIGPKGSDLVAGEVDAEA